MVESPFAKCTQNFFTVLHKGQHNSAKHTPLSAQLSNVASPEKIVFVAKEIKTYDGTIIKMIFLSAGAGSTFSLKSTYTIETRQKIYV